MGPLAPLLRPLRRADRDAPGERAKECCACGHLAYPRLSPAVIVLVTRGREALLAPAAALLAAWLHPWQGTMLFGILVLAALWHAFAGEATARELTRALWPTLAAALLPALYYFVLSRADASWSLSAEIYRIGLDVVPPWRLLLALGPLALPAVLGYRGRVEGIQDRVLRLWAPVGFALYLLPPTPVRFHAFNGLTIPLAILAVRGLSPYVARAAGGARGTPARRGVVAAAAVAACALVVVPGAFDRMRSARGAVRLNQQPFHLERGEEDALRSLERAPGGGGVLASAEFGALIPHATGRETWVGTPSWSPDFGERSAAVADLFAGRLSAAQARRVVRSSGARFVLQDCRGRADLAGALRPLLVATRRHGCAELYELELSRRRTARR